MKGSSVRSDAYYRRFTGDYLKDTLELSMEEDGAYNRLLDSYYAKETLPADPERLYRIARAMTDSERKAIDKVVRIYFRQEGDRLFQDRVERELAARREFLKEQARKSRLGVEERLRRKAPNEKTEDNPEDNPGDDPGDEPGITPGNTRGTTRGSTPGNTRGTTPASASAFASGSGSASPAPEDQNPRRRRRGKDPPRAFVLPPTIPAETWAAFEEHRNRLRKPMTDRARALIVGKIDKLGQDPVELLEQSIRKGWQDVFPLRDDGAPPARDRPASEPRGFAAIRALRISEGRDPETGEPLEQEVGAK